MSRGGLDNLDTYDLDLGDALDDDPFHSPVHSPGGGGGGGGAKGSSRAAKGKRKGGGAGAGLGLDEEVSVAKRARVPTVKLDEARLLSDEGIPRLRKRAAGLRLKGKGHEFSDASRLLSLYQLWLDDLFPKARFLDALAMVEKTGHKKIMAKARQDWIDDEGRTADADAAGQSGERNGNNGRGEDGSAPRSAAAAAAAAAAPPLAAPPAPRTPPPRHAGMVADDEDLYGSTPGVQPLRRPAAGAPADNDDDDDDDEDLDALMAEAAAAEAEAQNAGRAQGPSRSLPLPPPSPPDTDFADDEAALAEMGM